MSEFKSGDLAITLVSTKLVPAGSVVTLLEPMEIGDEVLIDGELRRLTARAWVCRHSDFDKDLGFSERRLMPLRGDFAPESQKVQEVPA